MPTSAKWLFRIGALLLLTGLLAPYVLSVRAEGFEAAAKATTSLEAKRIAYTAAGQYRDYMRRVAWACPIISSALCIFGWIEFFGADRKGRQNGAILGIAVSILSVVFLLAMAYFVLVGMR